MLRPGAWDNELIWGRPFSICHADAETLTIFYQVVGRGTRKMADLKPGDSVVTWGPLGNGFSLGQGAALMLAGGVGLAPFIGASLAHAHPERLRLVFGHRLDLGNYPWDMLPPAMSAENHHEEKPGDLDAFLARLEQLIREHADQGPVLACGPTPFLRAVQRMALDCGAQAQLSLENRMACGVGACLGCVSEDPDGNRIQICTRGPVFPATDITL